MLRRLFGLPSYDHNRQRQALYGLVVTQARRAELYSQMGVPDTFDGRLEMMILHLYPLHRRLLREGNTERRLSQGVFDAFFEDMDSALREAAVGDQAVPKRLQKITRVFYGHAKALDAAMDLPQEQQLTAIDAVLEGNLVDTDNTVDRSALAKYLLQSIEQIDATDLKSIVGGKFAFAPFPA
ncbi:MAG: ubiquinol-cytochrome C chaperone family protein [Pseudomonadota bacterium]